MRVPKVSVVMPVHNGERYLRQAMDSIIGQSYKHFEFLIVDDGSVDGTRSILEGYNDSRIKIIRNNKSEGLTKALNKGIRMVSGKYIARQDADDISLPRRFEMQVIFLEKHPDYGMVGSSYFQIDENGKILSQINVLSEDTQIRESIMAQNCFAHGSVMMRKDTFEEVGSYDERFKFAQDYDLWLRIIETFKVANIRRPLYCWRFTKYSISHTNQNEQRYYASLALQDAIRRKYLKERPINISPTVSVIIPTYNRPETLLEAINSVLNQEYRDYEIIVVNDGGVDVQYIITRLGNKGRIIYIRHECNKGVAAARNTGLRLSKGKYIAYLDDDDIFYPNHLEILVKYLEGSDNKVAYTNSNLAFQKDVDGQHVISHRVLSNPLQLDKNQILIENFIPALCLMHERSCIDEVGFFVERLKSYEDWDLWIRMAMKYKFIHIDILTCEHRLKEDKTNMANVIKEQSLWAMYAIYNKYKQQIRKNPGIYSKQKKHMLKRLEEVYMQRPIIKQVERHMEFGSGVEMNEVNYNETKKLTGKKREEKSINMLKEIINRNPYHALANRDLGSLYYKKGDKWLALAHIARCLSMEPEDIEAMKYYEKICFELGFMNRAINMLGNIVRKNQKDIKTLLTQGFLMLCHLRKSDLVSFVINRLCCLINNIIQKRKIAKYLRGLSTTIEVHL